MVKRSTAVAVAILLLLIAFGGIYLAYRMGLIGAAIPASVVTAGSSNDTATTTNTSTSNSSSSSTLPSVDVGSAVSRVGSIFRAFVEWLSGFARWLSSSIATGSNIDKVINGFVYAAVFFIVGKLAESLVKVFKYIMYMLSVFSCIIAVLALVGII